MLSSEEVNALGQVLDTTWGRSSTSGQATMSVKAKLQDSKLELIFCSVATSPNSVVMSQQVPKLQDEGNAVTDKFLKTVKAGFKDLSGRALKTKVLSTVPSVEIVNLQPHISAKRTILFRLTTILSVE